MAKVKTNKTAQKRFRITPTGKILYRKRGWNHLRSKKSKKVRSRKKVQATLAKSRVSKVRKMLKVRK